MKYSKEKQLLNLLKKWYKAHLKLIWFYNSKKNTFIPTRETFLFKWNIFIDDNEQYYIYDYQINLWIIFFNAWNKVNVLDNLWWWWEIIEKF